MDSISVHDMACPKFYIDFYLFIYFIVKNNFVENRLFNAQKHMLEGIVRYLKRSRYLVCQIKRMKKPKELQSST